MKRKKTNQKKKHFHSIDSDLLTWPIPKHGRLFMFQFLSIQIFYAGTSKMSWQTDWTVIFALIFLSFETFKVKLNPYSKANKHDFRWMNIFVVGRGRERENNILFLISRLSIIVEILHKSEAWPMEETWSLVNGHIAWVMLYELWFQMALEECANCTEGGLWVWKVIFQHLSYDLTTRNKSIILFTENLNKTGFLITISKANHVTITNFQPKSMWQNGVLCII